MIPKTRYTASAGVSIAYQVFGEGPVDIVYVPGWFSNIELDWEDPYKTRFFNHLARFARLIRFDKRGTGLSDRDTTAYTLEERMDDVRAVMDAAGSDRAALIGSSEGGPMCALFAATLPSRTVALIMLGSYARRVVADDYPWGVEPAAYLRLIERMRTDWGTAIDIRARVPSLAEDESYVRRWARYLRMSASPKTAVAYAEMNGDIDVRPILSSIRVPTLVLHATGDRVCDVGNARYLARAIPTARLVEIATDDHLTYVGAPERTLEAIESFVTGGSSALDDDRMVCTVMFTDIVRSTERAATLGDERWAGLLEEHHQEVRRELAVYRGIEIKTIGDGFHARFDGPARAIRCACAVRDAIRRLGLEVRIGLHTGECLMRSSDVEGIAVHLAARVAHAADAGAIVVSQTVRDLVAGSGIGFEDLGVHELRGVPDSWRLYAVRR